MKTAKQHAPIDENVKIPAAIRAAANRATEIHNAAYQTEPAKEETPQEKSTQEDQKQKEQKTTEDPKTNEGEDGGKREPQTPEPETPAKAEVGEGGDPSTPKAPGDTNEWEHKYKSLKPRFDRQAQQISDLNAQVSNLQRTLAARNEAPKQPPSETRFKDISDEERETYGDEFLDVSARAAQAKINPHISKLEREIENLKSQLGGVEQKTQQTTTANLYATLDAQVPDWKKINRSAEFLDWVNLPDPFSGVIRQHMLQEAFNKGDGSRVVAFFKGFLSDEAATDPVGRGPEMPAKPNPANGKVPLAELAAPGRAKAPAASTPPGEKETITHAQIAQFYADVQRGRYRGNEEEKERLERMIFQATNEGRVV